MLEPGTRALLLDVLRPPDGWQLGHAVGTTFTLDLQALLIAPLAFAMFDWAVEDDGTPDPIAMLEALRRNAERTTVFHQAGMVSVPKWQPLFVHLEGCVSAVTAPQEGAIFHPKVWVLQFVREDEQPRYRLLVLSRNLTFDTSWDTVVALDGHRRTKNQYSRPVGEFIDGLLDASPRLDPDRRATIEQIAQDVRHIKFDAPDGVDQILYHHLGLGSRRWPFPKQADRQIVISPFAGADALDRLVVSDDAVLISRPETLDEVGADALAGFHRTLVMRSEAVEDVDVSQAPAEDTTHRPDTEAGGLRGLHAKVFAYQVGSSTRLFTGSANATSAGFGHNVEFLVELRGQTDAFPVTTLLGGPDGVSSFADLCDDYTPAEDAETDPTRKLTALLEQAQRTVGALAFEAHVTPEGDDFLLELRADHAPDLPDAVTALHCWHITAEQGHQVTPRLDTEGLRAAFGRVSYEGLTAFFAFELVAELDGRTDRVRFVVCAELIGAPDDRAETVIARMLANRSDLLRYLLFLLSDADAGMIEMLQDIARKDGAGDGRWDPFGQSGLMERLLRTLVRDPSKLDRVGRLLHDLEVAGRRDDLVPEGLDELWAAIVEARPESGAEQVRV